MENTNLLGGMTYCLKIFGCQMNENDGERVAGMLDAQGCMVVDTIEAADIVVFITCCVREAADIRLMGQVASLKNIPPAHEGQPRLVCVGGCIGQRDGEKLRESLSHVDIVFGTHNLGHLVQLLKRRLETGAPVVETIEANDGFSSDLPATRARSWSAWVPIMTGCNNFCTYCIVPYVRGRERSRRPEDIVAEARELVAAGYKEITLLGQNVNSYGKDLDTDVSFADLIAMINDIPGEFLIRFMTSHPKDATEELFRTMAECEKCAHQLHLPVQSGSDRILKAMNRHYDSEKYLQKVELARSYMPDLVLTTDIIVGFPNETEEDFEETLRLCEKVRYDAMFTFIYSKRVGTPAAEMPDPYSREDKQKHFDRLLDVANRISAEKHREYEGKTVRVLVDGETGKEQYNLSSRTNGGRLVHLKGSKELLGRFINVKITGSNTWALYGEPETED